MVARPDQLLVVLLFVCVCVFVCLCVRMFAAGCFLHSVCVFVVDMFVVVCVCVCVCGWLVCVCVSVCVCVYVAWLQIHFPLVTIERFMIAWLRDPRSLCSECCSPAMLFSGKGRVLTVPEMAKLMGHDIQRVDMRCGECAFKHMLGMSVHRSTMGFALIGLLASLRAVD